MKKDRTKVNNFEQIDIDNRDDIWTNKELNNILHSYTKPRTNDAGLELEPLTRLVNFCEYTSYITDEKLLSDAINYIKKEGYLIDTDKKFEVLKNRFDNVYSDSDWKIIKAIFYSIEARSQIFIANINPSNFNQPFSYFEIKDRVIYHNLNYVKETTLRNSDIDFKENIKTLPIEKGKEVYDKKIESLIDLDYKHGTNISSETIKYLKKGKKSLETVVKPTIQVSQKISEAEKDEVFNEMVFNKGLYYHSDTHKENLYRKYKTLEDNFETIEDFKSAVNSLLHLNGLHFYSNLRSITNEVEFIKKIQNQYNLYNEYTPNNSLNWLNFTKKCIMYGFGILRIDNTDLKASFMNWYNEILKTIPVEKHQQKENLNDWTNEDYYNHYINTKRFAFSFTIPLYKNKQFNEVNDDLKEYKNRYDYIFNKLTTEGKIELKNDFCDRLELVKNKQTQSKFKVIIENMIIQINEDYLKFKSMDEKPQQIELNIFDKIIKELDIIEVIFYSQMNPVDLNLRMQKEYGRYCNEIYINSNIELFKIPDYKNYYTNRISNNESTKLLYNELKVINTRALKIYNYFLDNLKEHLNKKDFFVGENANEQIVESTGLYLVDNNNLKGAMFELEVTSELWKKLTEKGINYNYKNETLINFCVQLIDFIDLSAIISTNEKTESNKSNEKYKTQNLFKVGLLFATGEMNKYFTITNKNETVIKEGYSAPKIAKDLNNIVHHKYISASINNYREGENKGKNIFNSNEMMTKIISHCEAENIDINPYFKSRLHIE